MSNEPEVAKRKRGRPKADGSSSVGDSAGQQNGENGSVGPEALMAMTLELLSERPPSEITRASLARHANVDPGLIRYYFSNRDSLMRSAAQSLTESLQTRARAATPASTIAPEDQICTRARALLDFKLDNPFYHRLMMEEMARSGSEESVNLFDEVAGAAIARYKSYIDEGVAEGSLKEVNPAFLYMAIIGLCDFFVTASPSILKNLKEEERKDVNRDYANFICDLLINGLRARQ
jgi:TetR/AcrR family transcriptional regulator